MLHGNKEKKNAFIQFPVVFLLTGSPHENFIISGTQQKSCFFAQLLFLFFSRKSIEQTTVVV